MTTPDPTTNAAKERRVSLTVTIRMDDIGQLDAMQLDNALRDVADDFGAEVLTSQGNPRPSSFVN